jgi:bifunctional pyridoxal-dependent enzyme with beta-cystathionase and maltose regulon repressor activities
MFCAYRCSWVEKEAGSMEAEDGYSYSFQKEDLQAWIDVRTSTTYSDVVRYIPGVIEIVRIDVELFSKICKHRIYSTDAYEGVKDLGLLSEYKQGLKKGYGIQPRVEQRPA